MKPYLKLLSLTALTMMLTNCSGESISPYKKCGTLIPYTQEEDTAFREELVTLGRLGLYPNTMNRARDYKTTRDTIRDCLGIDK